LKEIIPDFYRNNLEENPVNLDKNPVNQEKISVSLSVVAAKALALQQFSNSFGVMKLHS
jgi:hypothetical protein